jgi:hypothetical protein
MSDRRRWYTAGALLRDLTNQHHHHLRAASEEEVERRMRERYPQAGAVLVRPREEAWLRVLKEHELGVRLEYDRDGGFYYVPNGEE